MMLLAAILLQVTYAIPGESAKAIVGASCSAGQFVNAISVNGVGTCAAASGSGDLLAANNLSYLSDSGYLPGATLAP